MRRLIMSRLIRIYTVCPSDLMFWLRPLFRMMVLTRWKYGRAQWLNLIYTFYLWRVTDCIRKPLYEPNNHFLRLHLNLGWRFSTSKELHRTVDGSVKYWPFCGAVLALILLCMASCLLAFFMFRPVHCPMLCWVDPVYCAFDIFQKVVFAWHFTQKK